MGVQRGVYTVKRYQCRSGKFIRFANRIESKVFLPELECSSTQVSAIAVRDDSEVLLMIVWRNGWCLATLWSAVVDPQNRAISEGELESGLCLQRGCRGLSPRGESGGFVPQKPEY